MSERMDAQLRESKRRLPRPVPVQEKERIELVDIIRGFAVFGILVANIVDFSGQHGGVLTWQSWPDRAVVFLTEFLIRAKFYTLFSFLFGWGMSIQLQRAQGRGAKFLPVFLRRLLVLLVFGVLHGWFLWSGDILGFYAVCGVFLVLFRHRSPRLLVSASVLLLAFAVYLNSPIDSAEQLRGWYADATAPLRWSTHPDSYYREGTYQQANQLRLQEYVGTYSYSLYFFGPVFGMFLLGLAWGKRGYFQDFDAHTRFYKRLLWWTLPAGLLLNAVFALSGVWNDSGWPEWLPTDFARLFVTGTRIAGAPLLMLGYVSAIALLSRREDWRNRLAPLAPVGRMALTNYLAQSLVATLFFYDYGLGFYGELGPAFSLIVALLIYGSQMRLSKWWLARYQFGPVEWLWRTLSYRQRPPYHHGDTYSSMRPNRWVRRVQEIPAHFQLGAVWSLLLVWALVLYSGFRDLDGPVRLITLGGSPATAATPLPGSSGSLPGEGQEQPPESVATPDVRPVRYDPGPLAAAGDTLGLAQQFDPQTAQEHIAALSGDAYAGRYAGSTQGFAAGDYIAAQFADYGLQPAGEQGSYFQPFPLAVNQLASLPTLVVTSADGETHRGYRLHEDFSVVGSAYLGAGTAGGSVFWANNCQPEDFHNADAGGKVVLCRLGSSLESGRYALEHGAVGLLLLAEDDEYAFEFGATYRENWLRQTIPAMRVSQAVVSDLLEGSGLTIEDLGLRFDSFDLPARVDMSVEMVGEQACAANPCSGRNVLGVIPGRDADLRDEVVIIGAHYDHLGRSPDGLIAWPGANDNASGVAVQLEIARQWQLQGYVPNRTVVFAAWDAEEQGLLGSRFYVENPQYALERTVFYLNLDMVGAGVPPLLITGSTGFEGYFREVASRFDVPTERLDSGGSDHIAFIEAGVPANMLIWDGADLDLRYHRPGDTIEVIQSERLQQAGRIAGLALLGFSEGAADIHALIADRTRAVLAGDLQAFLATSSAAWQENDKRWFEDARSVQPLEFEIDLLALEVVGDRASAFASLRMAYPDEDGQVPEGGGQPRSYLDSRLPVQFVKESGLWKWGGADLKPVLRALPAGEEEGTAEAAAAFSIFVYSGVDYLAREQDEENPPPYPLSTLGVRAAEQYAGLAEVLGLQAGIDASILLYPDQAALEGDSLISGSLRDDIYVQPGLVKLVYSEGLIIAPDIREALVWLLLAEAGVEAQAAPWLWRGLAPALEAIDAPVDVQARNLPRLLRELAGDEAGSSTASHWAAVDFLQRRGGWDALGAFILDLGRACRRDGCADDSALDGALRRQYGLSAAEFASAWQGDWNERISAVQTGLDELLETRRAALQATQPANFMATVDRVDASLVTEQEHWFDAYQSERPASFELIAEPLALLDNGDVLATVSTIFSRTAGVSSSTAESTVLFRARGGRLLWAGEPLELLRGVIVEVAYPAGMEQLAAEIRDQAEETALKVLDAVGTRLPSRLRIKLYNSPADYRASIALFFPGAEWLPGWTGPGESIKLVVSEGQTMEEIIPALTTNITKQLLYSMGVDSQWLLQGAAAYLAFDLDNPLLRDAAVGNLWRVAYRAADDTLPALDALPAENSFEDRREWAISTAYAWDVLRYIAITYGEGRMWDLVQLHGSGQSPAQAVANTLGISLDELSAEWKQSLARAHVDQRWVEAVRGYDAARVEEQIAILSAPELAGRQAGSPGAQSTAEYIASLFELYGLLPLIPVEAEIPAEPETAVEPALPEQEALSYLQYFPIQYAEMLAAPVLNFYNLQGELVDSFTFRSDFGLALGDSPVGGMVQSEMVWILDSYQDMELSGKIAVRRSQQPIGDELAQAVAHGAGGLILIKDRELSRERDLIDKRPLPLAFSDEAAIPVVVLGADGFAHFQEVVGLTPIDLAGSPPALLMGVQARIEIPLSPPQTGRSANVLGLLPGSDPEFQDEIIIVGAHYDHVGDDPDLLICGEAAVGPADFNESDCQRLPGRRYSGRNDNASGVGLMLEVLRIWQESGYQPKRSVLFAAWGAQEAGQAGSQYFSEHPPLALENTAAMIQLDSVAGGRGYYLLAQGEWDSEGLMLFGVDTANEIFDGRLTITKESDISDQLTFQAIGIPALLLSWDEAADSLNWPDEMADEVQFYRINIAGQLFTLMLMSLAY